MNNEPVAWMNKTATSWVSTFIHPETEPDEWIPLYTHEYERPHNTVLVPCDKLAEMQAEIKALKEELDKQGKMIPFTESEIKYSKPQFPNKPVGWWDGNHKNVIGISKTKECEDWIPLYTHPVEEQELLGEIAQLKHMNKNWSISEGLALQEIELMKHFLQANQLYLSFQEWKHSDSARAILRKVQEK